MSVLSDFNKLHVDTKTFIVGILLIGPFWFIDFYLFHKSFFHSNPVYLPIIFYYCLSICLFLPVFLGTFGFGLTIFKDAPEDSVLYGIAIFFCLGIMVLSTLFTYTDGGDFGDLILNVMTWTAWYTFTGLGLYLAVKLIPEVVREIKNKRRIAASKRSETLANSGKRGFSKRPRAPISAREKSGFNK